MPLHVDAEFAKAREHAGVQGGGRQATTPVAPAQTLAQNSAPRAAEAPPRCTMAMCS